MKTRKLQMAASCLTVLGLSLASCALAVTQMPTPYPSQVKAPATAAVPASTPRASVEEPKYGGILTKAIRDDPPNLDVHQSTSVNVLQPLANVYNGLVRYDTVDVNKVVPDLAEKWDISPDGKVYTFHLLKGVRWHDAKPFTSDDAKFSIQRMAFWKEHKIVSPRGGQLLSAVDKVENPDSALVRVTLKYASASFLGNTAAGWVLMLPMHVIQSKGDMKKDAVGTGAFKWKGWNPGVSLELVKNSDYFRKGLPHLDGLAIYPIKDGATRFAAFRTGRVKMTPIGNGGLTNAEAETLRKQMADKVEVIAHGAAVHHQLFMNPKRKPWDDIRVRRAVDLGYDRRAAITINDNVGYLGAAMHPKGAWGIPEEDMAKRPGYRLPKDEDIAAAKNLLAEAGYSAGFKTKMIIRGGIASEQQGVVGKDQLAKIGIELALEVTDTATQQDRLNRHDYDVSSLPTSDPADDPDVTLSAYYVTGGSRNYGEFSDEQIDKLFQQQAGTLDEKERKKLVLELQARILDLAIHPNIFWDVIHLGMWKEVRGYKPGFGQYSHNNLDHVWLAK